MSGRTMGESRSPIPPSRPKWIVGASHQYAALARGKLAAVWRWGALPFTLALTARAITCVVGAIAAQVVGRANTHDLLAIWNWWDSTSYLRVAAGGYRYSLVTGSIVNSFPLYPLLIRGAEPMARIFASHSSYLLAGMAVSWVAFALACALLYHLTRERFGPSAASSAVLLVCVFPFGFYFGAVFTESVYLLLAVLAFAAIEQGNWWLAGGAALLAGAERPPGLLVGACVIAAYALDWLRTRHPLRLDLLALTLTPLGTAAYFAYLWWRFGDALAYMHSSEIGWHAGHLQTTGLLSAWTTLTHLGADLTSGQYARILGAVYVIILVVVLVASVPVARLLGLPYALFTAGSVLLPVATSPGVNSLGRYASVAFPVFILLAVGLCERQTARALVVTVFAVLLGLFTALFVSGYPLA